MNTPKPKPPQRFNPDEWSEKFFGRAIAQGSSEFGMALVDEEAGRSFAAMVSEFTHLEQQMERFMARLLGSAEDVASHVMRSIVNARARIDLMKALLARARHNADKPAEFDEIIAEFEAINRLRNNFVHARWMTCANTGKTLVIMPKDDPFLLDLSGYVEFDVVRFSALRTRITNLWRKISEAVFRDIERGLLSESTPPQSDTE